MTVGELLERISSRELTEWSVYEKENGILGPTYERQMLQHIHYMLQQQLYAFGSANTAEGKTNPVPEPKMLPGPAEYDEDEEE